jgi:hypothetical protein
MNLSADQERETPTFASAMDCCSSTSNNAGATYNQRPPEFFNNLDRRMIS